MNIYPSFSSLNMCSSSISRQLFRDALSPENKVGDVERYAYLKDLQAWFDAKDLVFSEFKVMAIARIIKFMDEPIDDKNLLDLSKLYLATIPPIYYLNKLKRLDLSHNNIERIDPDIFLFNTCLDTLVLSFNQISQFDDSSKISSQSLSTLDLEHNCFTKVLPSYFSMIPNLSNLYLNDNDISFIDPSSFSSHFSFQWLILSGNKISYFPFQLLKNLCNIDFINLSHNRIESFNYSGETLDDWLALQCPDGNDLLVNLSHNPIGIYDLSRLYEVQFSAGYIGPRYTLPMFIDVFGMMHVKDSWKASFDLPLKNNRLSAYMLDLRSWMLKDDGSPEFIRKEAYFSILQYLNCSRSHALKFQDLCTIPPLYGLPRLRELSFIDSSFTSIDPSVFSNNLDLLKLDFKGSGLTYIDENVFSKLKNLKKLNLDFNQITDIHDDAFLNLPLKKLSLDGNALRYISPKVLRTLYKLKEIHLCYNLLTRFDWPFENNASPTIFLHCNRFSLRTLIDLNVAQNVLGYTGPRYLLSFYDASAVSTEDVRLDTFGSTLRLWGRNDSNMPWSRILTETNGVSVRLYNALNVFFLRLYNETPRLPSGEFSENLFHYVSTIFNILEKYATDLDLLNYLSNMASDSTSDCVDRIGVTMISMYLYVCRYEAEKIGDMDAVNRFSKQLYFLNCLIRFVDDVHVAKIVYDLDKGSFKRISSISSKIAQSMASLNGMSWEDCSKKMRLELIVSLNEAGGNYRVFNIGDQTEDVLLILNNLNSAGLCSIDPIDMRFGSIATLGQYMEAVLDYLKGASESS